MRKYWEAGGQTPPPQPPLPKWVWVLIIGCALYITAAMFLLGYDDTIDAHANPAQYNDYTVWELIK